MRVKSMFVFLMSHQFKPTTGVKIHINKKEVNEILGVRFNLLDSDYSVGWSSSQMNMIMVPGTWYHGT